ncbi:type III-B CRISPR module RAMP protein Cmr1 [Psychrobacter arenosus]|uniref:type III-B CRISPR module RAMP protein Cmr1 n=1 Tax=Psychrobacter arenosus TaxID=256326 RepID=UPI0019198318|nr:type III-B CRISPR module RAMP protein Cmr1 [Psychrobacter arenosus]
MDLPNFNNSPGLIQATYYLNTPMFAAGSNQKEAELTPTTFKGVLRFWWRALNWSKIRLKYPDKKSSFQELYKQEAQLFGSAAKDGQGKSGQGACLVNAIAFINKPVTWRYTGDKQGINYLLGQGLYNFRNGLSRAAFAPEQSFSISLTVKDGFVDSIIDVLKLIGVLGGFGSRSRHAIGSVTLTKLSLLHNDGTQSKMIEVDQTIDAVLANLFKKYQCRDNSELPPLSAFYQDTRIDVIHFTDQDAISLVNKLGIEEMKYRSFGREGEIEIASRNKIPAERNFQQDHDFILNITEGKRNLIAHPKRVVFGLPHNYFYSGKSTSGMSGDIDSITGRRASPLIQHIHKNSQNQYQIIQCLLKSEFLPGHDNIKITAKQGRDKKKPISVTASPDWKVITDFMDRPLFDNKETLI